MQDTVYTTTPSPEIVKILERQGFTRTRGVANTPFFEHGSIQIFVSPNPMTSRELDEGLTRIVVEGKAPQDQTVLLRDIPHLERFLAGLKDVDIRIAHTHPVRLHEYITSLTQYSTTH